MAKTFPLQIIISAIDKFSSTFATFGSKMDRLGKKATQLGQSLSLKISAPLAAVGLYSLRSAAQLQQLEIRFASLVGSAGAAADVMERLKRFTAETPFDLPDVANAAAGLLAAGFAAKDLEYNLKILGDIAAGSGGSLGDMVPLFTEIRIKGKAFTQDLRQFATRGIPIIAVLAKQLGKSESKIFDLASKGKISFKMIERALRSMTEEGGLFADQMEKQSKSLSGIWGQFADTVMFASAQLGEAMAKAVNLGENLQKLGNWIKGVTTAFTQLSPQTQKFIVWGGLALAVLGPLLIFFGALAASIAFLIPIIAAIFTPLGGLIALFVAAAAAGIWLGKAFADLVHSAGGFGNVLLMLGGAILDMLVAPLTSALKLLVSLWELFGKAPAGLKNLANFSFAQAAANSAVSGPTGPSGPALGSGQAMKDQYALQTAARMGDKAAIEILFKNPPPGTRTSVVQNTGANLTVEQGVSMVGAD